MGSMQIVCPHCTTSYAVDAATFGSAGRTVRCARCKETWLAFPEEVATAYAATTGAEDGSGWDDPPPESSAAEEVPVVDSPSISSDMPASPDHEDAEWTSLARHEVDDILEGPRRTRSLIDRLGLSTLSLGPIARSRGLQRLAYKSPVSLPVACAAMGAVLLGLVIWRADIVRLMPQTATFFKMVGLGVNLRGLAFEDVKVSTETVDNKPVLIIEGNIVDIGKKAVDIPRLRFLVRDAHGTEIYAWNAVLDQPVLRPGEKAWFKSRLASPPPEGREIVVRFFNRRDLSAGGA
jgi:predicted Zn finger-like uncharacterized protein